MDRNELRRRKKELRITTGELAVLAGLPVGTVSKVMTGETKNPSYITIEKIDAALCRLETEARLDAYSREMAEYIKQHPDETFDPLVFEQYYRKKHNLGDSPIIPIRSNGSLQGNSGNLALIKAGSTVRDMEDLGETRWVELIDGHIFVDQFPGMRHQTIVTELGRRIDMFIRENGGKCRMFNVGVNVYLDQDDETLVGPDVMVVCDPSKITESGVMGAPDWIIEVVSPSSRKKDYGLKLHKYMLAGVREYWIIDPDKSRVTVYVGGEPLLSYLYGFEDDIPVRIYDSALKIRLSDIDMI